MGNVYVAGATSVLLWHIVVNGAVVMFGIIMWIGIAGMTAIELVNP
jgi:hypothetical protein